jgi:hypothetical protein
LKTLIVILMLTIPTFAQSPFWEMYERDTIAEKKAIWFTLTQSERVEARRMNFAWATGRLRLSEEQRDYLQRFSTALPTITRDVLDAFQAEAIELFPIGGDLLFGSIGPYRQCSVFTRILPSMLILGNCPCSVGSSFNMSCEGTCDASAGRCNHVGSGCGFAWMYSCNGYCAVE